MPLRAGRPVRSRVAATLVFVVAGWTVGAWAGSIPAIKQGLGLSDAVLGMVLLCFAGGAIVAMTATERLGRRFGLHRVMLGAGVLFAAGLVLPGLAPGVGALGGSVLLLGLCLGITDVAMNAYAAQVERAWGSAIMSSFHAGFSLGGLLGAAALSALLSHGLARGSALALACAVSLGLMLAAVLAGPDAALADNVAPGAPRSARQPLLPRGALLGIGVLAMLSMILEGAMADWTGVFLADVLGATAATAALGFAGFSLTMTVGRVVGDAVVQRLGRQRVVVGGSALAGLGLLLALSKVSVPAAIVGFGMVGLGLANVVPVLFTAAAALGVPGPSAGVAAAATMGYAGFLAGPPLIGLLSQTAGLRAALGVLVLGALAMMGLGASSVLARPERPDGKR